MYRKKIVWLLVIGIVLLLPSRLVALVNAPSLDQVATTSITDFKASVSVDMANEEELKKINRDFGTIYRLKKLDMYYKAPDKLRMENKFALMIVNGETCFFKVPILGIAKKDDLGSELSKRHSLMDIGLIPASSLDYIDSKYLHTDTIAGQEAWVFSISFKGDTSSSYRIWISPKYKVILKKEWYDSDGKLRASFYYRNLKEIKPGLWFPTQLEVKNAEGVTAAITSYNDVTVNLELNDGLFKIS
jgi:outer membrane lipoprotein-sorting protein